MPSRVVFERLVGLLLIGLAMLPYRVYVGWLVDADDPATATGAGMGLAMLGPYLLLAGVVLAAPGVFLLARRPGPRRYQWAAVGAVLVGTAVLYLLPGL